MCMMGGERERVYDGGGRERECMMGGRERVYDGGERERECMMGDRERERVYDGG